MLVGVLQLLQGNLHAFAMHSDFNPLRQEGSLKRLNPALQQSAISVAANAMHTIFNPTRCKKRAA